MLEQGQNKIYYKGNPYTRRNYIPHSALKNRTKPNYLVQLPQGQDYFGSSRKKQYANVHHQSEIKNTGLFEQQRPTYHHGTYEVSDIEGAASSSLISQAVRNRLKGNSSHYNRGMKASNALYSNLSLVEAMQKNEYEKQKSLLDNPRPEQNYHFSRVKHIQTEPVEPDYNDLEHKYNPEHKSHKYTTQQTQTEGQNIKQLEEQLFGNAQTRLRERQKEWNNDRKESYNAEVLGGQSESEKKMEVSRHYDAQNRHKRSIEEIKSLWHGDNHKIMLFPSRDIRRLNPTYLSAENYVGDKIYNKYYSPY